MKILKAPGWGLFVLLCSVRKPVIYILIAIYSSALLGPAAWNNCKPLFHFIRNLRSEDEFVLVISKDAYAQLKHEENEMWWNGCLVDIKTVSIKNDQVELLVEADHFETRCINQVSKHKFPKEPTALWQWFNKVYTCDKNDDAVLISGQIETLHFTKAYPLSIAFAHVDCPPPDAA